MPVMVVTRARRRPWQVQEAKARFSALVRAASTFGPQTITVRGRRAAVVLSPEDYDRLQRPRLSLAEFMARSPLVGVELDLERDRSLPGDGVCELVGGHRRPFPRGRIDRLHGRALRASGGHAQRDPPRHGRSRKRERLAQVGITGPCRKSQRIAPASG